MMKHKLKLAMVAVVSMAGLGTAQAIPASMASLIVTDGINSVLVMDGGMGSVTGGVVGSFTGDVDPGAGGVATSIVNLGVWEFSIAAGTTKPALGSAEHPMMHLNVNARSAGPGNLWVYFSDANFGPSASGVMVDLDGLNSSGATSFLLESYADTNNMLFETQSLLTSQTGSGVALGGLPSGAFPYSLTLVGHIAHETATTSSFDVNLRVPDGGSMLAMFGLSLVGLGFCARKLR